MSTDTPFEEWDDEEPGAPRGSSIKAQEQMSPVTVVLYVVFFYIVWQILTRSDDHEILEHLHPSSPLLGHHALEQQQRPSANSQPSAPYHLPYQLPQLAQPLSSSESTSTWRTVLNGIVYPIYLLITLLAIPLPFLTTALNLLASILSTILYPVTSTARLLARTFIIAPLNIVLSFLHALYPVYVFVGGVVGVGAFLGVAVGWVGRVLMWLLLGRKSTPGSSKKTKKRRSNKRHSMPAPALAPAYDYDPGHYDHPRDRLQERERDILAPRTSAEHPRSPSYEYERRYFPIVDYVQIGDDMVAIDSGRGNGREAVLLGLRRRGVRV